MFALFHTILYNEKTNIGTDANATYNQSRKNK